MDSPEDFHLAWIARAARSTPQALAVLRKAMNTSASISKAAPERRAQLKKIVDDAERAIRTFDSAKKK